MQNILYKQRNLDVSSKLITFCTVAVFLYALTKFWIGYKISAYFEAAFLLPFYYIVFKNWWFFKRSKLTWLCIAMLAVPCLQFLVQYYQNPELAMKYQGVDKLFKLTFFLAAAFWLSYNLRLIPLFIAANLVGFYILISLQENPIDSILTMHHRYRGIFKGIHHEFMATYAGVAIISCIYFISSFSKFNIRTIILVLLLCSSIILSLFFIAFSQTRATIIGLILATLTVSIYFRKNKFILAAATISIISIVSLTLTSNIGNRIEKEINNFVEYIKGNSNLPKDNTGYRLLSWKIGLSYSIESPLLGMGGEANEDAMINSTEADKYMRENLHHFHSSIVDFGVAYGLFGALTIFLSVFLYFYYVNTLNLPTSLWIFSSAQFVFLYTVNIFESYYFYWQGGYLVIWTLAPLSAFLIDKNLHNQLVRPNKG